MVTMRQREIAKSVVAYTLVTIAAAVSVFPVYWAITMSLRPTLLTFSMPPVFIFRPTLEHYKAALIPGYGNVSFQLSRYLLNSIVVSLVTIGLTIVAGSLAAYALSRFRFRGKNGIAFFILATRMLPPVGTIIPIFLVMLRLNLLDTRISLILAYTALNIPLVTWMLRSFFDEIPVELEEAALVDGCSRGSALLKVVLPLVAPGMAATSVFAFLLSWNEFPLALVLTNRDAMTLPLLAMQFVSDEGIYWGVMAATSTLILIPPIVFVLFAQKYMIRGMTLGAVKG